MKVENISVYPSKIRVVPIVKLIKNLAKQSAEAYQALLDGAQGECVEKKNHKSHGEIVTPYRITNADGYDGDDPLDEFDYAVLSVCLSEIKTGNSDTTPAIILRGLIGKTRESSNGAVNANQREWILNSVRKLMSTIITVDLSDTNEKLGYDGEKKLTAPILPCKYVTTVLNGQPVKDVIHFTDDSPILIIAESRNQFIRYDASLLDVPNQNNTPLVIMLKNYVLRRVHEIKAHKMTPTLTFADIFKKCKISDNASRDAKYNARKIVEELFEHLKARNAIKTSELVKKGVAIQAVTFTF